MSLKSFHLVFITASSVLAFGCGVQWLKEFYADPSVSAELIAGLLALGCGVALVVYERHFLRKFRNLPR